jgi:hypothetical protein
MDVGDRVRGVAEPRVLHSTTGRIERRAMHVDGRNVRRRVGM